MLANSDVEDDLAIQTVDVQALEPANNTSANNVSLPPAMAAMHGKSSAEILATLNRTPLFMTDLEENDELEAFKALAYEGTPSEISLNFKERGNECFKVKQWTDAKEFYTKGIQVLQASQRERSMKSEEIGETKELDEEEQKTMIQELQLLEALLLNRAATHLSLQNYRSTTLDCASALRLNPRNMKAHHRSTKALTALNHFPEASVILSRALSLEPTNPVLLALAQDLRVRETERAGRVKEEARIERERRTEWEELAQALKKNGVKIRRTERPPEMGDARISLSPPSAENEREIFFPVLLLYPLPLQSDIITSFPGSSSLREQLSEILSLSPAWDTAGEYTIKGVECFMETISRGLIKVGRNIPLLGVLGRGDVEVVDEVVRVYVLPKGRSATWVREFKEGRGRAR